MSKYCPIYENQVLYMDCLECEEKVCKHRRKLCNSYFEPLSESICTYMDEVVDPICKRSKIWQILRSDGIGECRLNVGMMTDGLDRPYQYSCHIFDYEICIYSQTKHIEVFKKKWKSEKNVVKGLNLHHYYYVSENAPATKLFNNEFAEQITQEKLAALANRNWSESKNFCKNKKNLEAMREMKKKYIKCLEYHKQIIKYKNKYISYDYYIFMKNNNYL